MEVWEELVTAELNGAFALLMDFMWQLSCQQRAILHSGSQILTPGRGQTSVQGSLSMIAVDHASSKIFVSFQTALKLFTQRSPLKLKQNIRELSSKTILVTTTDPSSLLFLHSKKPLPPIGSRCNSVELMQQILELMRQLKISRKSCMKETLEPFWELIL